MIESIKYSEKIVEVAYYNFPLVHPKETVLKCIDALIVEYSNQNNKWISVKDKEVPKDGKCYHVFMVGNQQDFVTWVTNDNGKEPYFRDYFYKEDVTDSILFWRTLPDAPISTPEA